MFADDIRRALPGTPRGRLAELAAAVWKGFACGALAEGEAQQLAEEIAARKIVPPQLAARFTMAESAALAVIAAEVARRGLCRLTIGHIAALAGVGRTTVQNAVREAAALGILTSEEWRLTAWRSAPNTVRIVSPEWRTWLRMRDRKRAEADYQRQAEQGRSEHGRRSNAEPHGARGGHVPVPDGRWRDRDRLAEQPRASAARPGHMGRRGLVR